MSNTEQSNSSYNDMWQFIADYLPNYYSRDDVLRDDSLYRFITDDEVSEDDLKRINEAYQGDRKLVAEELMRLENGFFEESLKAYYASIVLDEHNIEASHE